ncbi:MAG: hypothetical protein EA001_14995 [Oscillatoriales cyanobacterium]|nr:MAG: hypothetical protein EA001_14995 [Oscillatoriales cyanobacterium]
MRLLCVSNGHGEDSIAWQLVRALQERDASFELASLPLVGEGIVYRRAGLPIISDVQTMPSGGFVYMDAGQLWRDLRGGLLGLTWRQWQAMGGWTRLAGRSSVVLAVGDIVPLLFAWASGLPYVFVGTAKSEYYLRGQGGEFLGSHRFEGWSGSVYLPWERWLMGRTRCRAVFPRDTLTAQVLSRWLPDRVFDCGNPMMDGLQGDLPDCLLPIEDEPLQVLLLPGSRYPEVVDNWQRIIAAIDLWLRSIPERAVIFRAAIAPGLDLGLLGNGLQAANWQWQGNQSETISWIFKRGTATLELGAGCFWSWAKAAHFAIATAGTATEQVVGLGKPVVTISGLGPQFTPAFAEAQTRLLGPSIRWAKEPAEVPGLIAALLSDPVAWPSFMQNGRQRLGAPGAADRMADRMLRVLGDLTDSSVTKTGD